MAGHIVEVWDMDSNEEQYQQMQLIGKGAYGAVYVVKHVPTGKEYAMKKMEVRISEEGVPQSILREISTLNMLGAKGHDNINMLLETFTSVSEDRRTLKVFLVMEKCDWDLYTFLKEIPRDMPDHQCRFIAKQILSGVDFLHTHNVIHRDLKPQNILINRDQSVKIADFGLSRSYSTNACFTTTVVTLWYRSPELLLQTSYNSSSDIWAVGCIITELYSRRALLPGQTEANQLSLTFQKLGTPTALEWPSGAVVERSFYPMYQRMTDQELFPKMTADGIELINRCLHYVADRRCSAKDALLMPYFTGSSPSSPPVFRAPAPPALNRLVGVPLAHPPPLPLSSFSASSGSLPPPPSSAMTSGHYQLYPQVPFKQWNQ